MNLKTLCQVMPLAKVEILRLLHSLERRGIVRLVSEA
jgi:DNA-binding IclR family transcriptional regulator